MLLLLWNNKSVFQYQVSDPSKPTVLVDRTYKCRFISFLPSAWEFTQTLTLIAATGKTP